MPAGVEALWRKLLRHGYDAVQSEDESRQDWHDAAIDLLCVADEASWGIGFYNSLPASAVFVEAIYILIRNEPDDMTIGGRARQS